MNIDLDNLYTALASCIEQSRESDIVNDVCDVLLDAMSEEPLFALAVILAARKYNNE